MRCITDLFLYRQYHFNQLWEANRIHYGNHIFNRDLIGKAIFKQPHQRCHSGYPGGLREERAKMLRLRIPTRLVETAVRGMLPKTKLGKQMYRKLKVYAGSEHPHAAQQPTQLEVS